MRLPSFPVGKALRSAWSALEPLPGGKRLFSAIFGAYAPYSGSVKPLILELTPGFARVRIRDRHAVRNHLESVHAIALMNLAEMASGLAMVAGLPDDARAIITHLRIDYEKKARGTLTAECRCDVPPTSERKEYEVESLIRDDSGDLVARATARWLVGPVQEAR